MNIKELKFLIEDLPDDMEIIMQKDAEGNGYSPLSELDTDVVHIPETPYSGYVYNTTSCMDYDMSEEEWKEILDKPRCLLFIPVN